MDIGEPLKLPHEDAGEEKQMKNYLKNYIRRILEKSLKIAAKEQGLDVLVKRLRDIAPDISDQYTSFKIDNSYTENTCRNIHAFQISLVNRVMGEFENPVIVDIGDSAGTHLEYIKSLYPDKKDMKCLSLNLDREAVQRIKNKGLQALQIRAEEIHNHNIEADIFLCFEIFEHLMNPCELFYNLSSKTGAKYLIITVPYLRRSRVGLNFLRAERKDGVAAENTHIFELSPDDWKLLFRFAGWSPAFENIYLQYPRKNWFWITKPCWKKIDFEGFYGAILTKDRTWCDLYRDWESIPKERKVEI